MPCYTIRLVTVEFKAKNKEVLKKVLESQGIRVYEENGCFILSGGLKGVINFTAQIATVREDVNLNRIKQLYAKQIIKQVAEKKKWLFKQTGENKIQLNKY